MTFGPVNTDEAQVLNVLSHALHHEDTQESGGWPIGRRILNPNTSPRSRQ